MKCLADTIENMTSTDYKKRFIAEYQQTKIRYEKLRRYLTELRVADEILGEPIEHDCPEELLHEQLDYMDEYLLVLEKRAVIEKIDLEW